MKFFAYIGIIALAATSSTGANFDKITLEPTVAGYGIDREFDGEFEEIFLSPPDKPRVTVGYVVNSYYHSCDRRGWLEFNINQIPNMPYIENITLHLNRSSSSNVTSNTSLYGYEGNGLFEAEDAYSTDLLLFTKLSSLHSVNVTNYISNLISESKDYAGFLMLENNIDANQNYSYLALDVTYVPEPSTLVLFGGGLLIFRKNKS